MVEAMLSYLKSDQAAPNAGERDGEIPATPDDSESDGDPLTGSP